MAIRSLLSRLVAAVAITAVVVLSTGAVASADVDPFQPKGPVAASTGGGTTTLSGGSGSSTTSQTPAGTGSGTTGTSSGTTTATTVSGSATTTTLAGAGAASQTATSSTGSSLPMTGAHTLRIFLTGLVAIGLGAPLVRAGRRRWEARHWPAC